jgi:hypothetical protein
MLREGVRGSRIARTSGRALGQTRPIHVFRRGSFPSGRRCETPTRGGVSRKVRIRRPACWRGFPALHAGLCRKAGPYSSKGGGGDTGRSSKAAPGRDRRPDRVSRRGLRVQQRGADAVLFHQGIRNSATRVSKALCHHRLISASVVVGAKASWTSRSGHPRGGRLSRYQNRNAHLRQ